MFGRHNGYVRFHDFSEWPDVDLPTTLAEDVIRSEFAVSGNSEGGKNRHKERRNAD